MYHAPYTAMMKVNPKDAIRDVALKKLIFKLHE